MIKIAVTGSMESGKTTVCHELSIAYKIPLFNSDKFAKELYRDNQELKQALIKRYGERIYNGQEIDSPLLASIIFPNKEELDWVNKTLHPFVRKGFEDFCKSKEGESDYCIMETALVYEHKIQDMFDFVVYVTAPEKARIERVKLRDQKSEENIKSRMQYFMDEDTKILLADFVIDTFCPQISLQEQCEILFRRLPLTEKMRSTILGLTNWDKENLKNLGINIYHIRRLKMDLINEQEYEKAAHVRDLEKSIQ